MVAKNRNLKNQTNEIIKSDEDEAIKTPKGFFRRYFSFRSKIAQRIYIFVFSIIAITAILSYNYTPNIGIELGKPSPRNIKANKSIQFEDTIKTEEDRNKNEAQVEDVYIYDSEVLNGKEGVLYQIKYFYLLSQIVQKKDNKTIEEKISYMTNLLGNSYNETIIAAALNLSAENNNLLMLETQNIAKLIMKDKIKPTEVDYAKSKVDSLVQQDKNISISYAPLVIAVLRNNINATAVFDPVATEKAKQDVKLATPPHMVSVLEGQTIVSEGEIVNESDISVLQKLGLLENNINWKKYVFIGLITIAVIFMLGYFIYKFNLSIYNNTRKVLIIFILLIIFTIIIKLLTTLSAIHLNLWNYLFPIIAASMIYTIIFDLRMGIVVTVCLALFAGVATNLDFSLAMAYLTGGIFSTYLVSNISQRSEVMKSGFISSLILAFLFFTINLVSGNPTSIALYTALGVLNGIICAILTIGLLPFIESFFKIVTAMGLLELSHTDQPILKEMLISAPGTYNHSLLVGHLSENSAKAIGADSLLVKVAALYHDLGKLRRPEYFSENQSNSENIHDKLNPSMSKNIIASHIRDGIEDAIKHKIPRKVIQIISQHHGTSLMTYFYEKQKDKETIKASNGSSELMKSHFRYQTRKPQSKEAAILMLADSVEAAVRSIDEITPKKIEQMVSYIIDNKIKDGQLNEADITLKEINIINQNLIDGLIAIYHSRINYPGTDLKIAGDTK